MTNKIRTQDISPLSPRLAGALFFAFFSLLFLIFTRYTLLPLKLTQSFHFGLALLIVPIIGALVGSMFGKILAKAGPWWRAFLIGLILSIVDLLLISLGVIINSYWHDPGFFSRLQYWTDYFVLYGLIFTSVLLIIGLWLIPITSLAAVYFNKRFFPGLLAVDNLRQQEAAQKSTKNPHD